MQQQLSKRVSQSIESDPGSVDILQELLDVGLPKWLNCRFYCLFIMLRLKVSGLRSAMSSSFHSRLFAISSECKARTSKKWSKSYPRKQTSWSSMVRQA